MNKRKLRIGAVGLGRAFSLMLPTFVRHPLVEMTAGQTRAPTRGRSSHRISAARATRTSESFAPIQMSKPSIVSTPHELHAQQVSYAASKGKHVLVEKPMALTLADCAAMTEAASKAGTVLVCGHSHSFDAPIAKTREIIASGKYGKLRMIHAMNYTDWLYRPRRPEELGDSGGVLFNQAPHQVDVARLLAGGDAKTVRAMAGDWDAKRPATVAYSALVTFGDGVFASLTYSGFAHFDSDEFMNWIGEGGQQKSAANYGAARRAMAGVTDELATKNARNYGGAGFNEPRAAPGLQTKHPHFGLVIASCDHADLRPDADGVAIYGDGETKFETLPPPDVPRGEVIDEFYAAVVEGKKPLHDGAWSLATMEVCLAMQASAKSQKEIALTRQVKAEV